VGRVKAETMVVSHTLNPDWNKVFAIGEDGVQGSTVEVTIWDADKHSQDDFLGGLMLHLAEVALRKPPEPPLPPQWYKLESKGGGNGRVRGTKITFPTCFWTRLLLLKTGSFFLLSPEPL
jgi:Ca2+-dependent lipid-binding protein